VSCAAADTTILRCNARRDARQNRSGELLFVAFDRNGDFGARLFKIAYSVGSGMEMW
jgi:hypothetical protein